MNLNKKGITLILSLVFIIILVVIVTVYAQRVTSNIRILNADVNDAKALYLAESGLNKAVWYLMNTAPDSSTDGSWRTAAYPAAFGVNPTDPQQELLSDGAYVMWVETSGANVLITAQGEINNLQRTIRQEFDASFTPPSAPSVIIDSWREI